MKNVEPQINEQPNNIAWTDLPLFRQSDEQTNAALHQTKSLKPPGSETGGDSESPKPTRSVCPRKPRRKSSEKKIRSQKRNVVPLKVFASPAEKAELENRAVDSGCSLSNDIRLNLGLALNESGRKKQKTQAAFDLDELNRKQ